MAALAADNLAAAELGRAAAGADLAAAAAGLTADATGLAAVAFSADTLVANTADGLGAGLPLDVSLVVVKRLRLYSLSTSSRFLGSMGSHWGLFASSARRGGGPRCRFSRSVNDQAHGVNFRP